MFDNSPAPTVLEAVMTVPLSPERDEAPMQEKAFGEVDFYHLFIKVFSVARVATQFCMFLTRTA